jgi:hypothetical protein
MPSKDLVTIEGTMTSRDALAWFEHPDNFTFQWGEDPEEISRRIDQQTVTAGSAADLFGEQEVLKAQDWLGRALQFISVDWRPSDNYDPDKPGSLPFYGLFKVATPDGEIHLMSCGAKNVVLKAAKASAEGWFPQWLKLVEVQVKNPVKGQKPPLDLVAAPAPVIDSDGKEF